MLSGRLVHLIEANAASIIDHVIWQIRREPDLDEISHLPDAELRDWGETALERLADWLAQGPTKALSERYEAVGRDRCEEGIPLYQVVRALFLLKDKIIDFVMGEAAAKTFLQLYAEEELEHRVDHLFDIAVCHLVKGYETALRRSLRVSRAH
jgi:hypothetical protein